MFNLNKSIIVLMALMIIGSAVFGGWLPADAAAERATSVTKKVVGAKPFDLWVGDGGMSSPNSMYNAQLKVERTVPYNRYLGDKRFINRWRNPPSSSMAVTSSIISGCMRLASMSTRSGRRR